MIIKEQIEKLNILIGSAMSHGKDYKDEKYEDIDLLDVRIEDFLYTLDEDFAKYIIIKHLYKYIGKTKHGNNMIDTYEVRYNEYNSDIEVQKYTCNDDICNACTCSTCPSAYDRSCINSIKNCTMCKFGDKKNGSTESQFKKKCKNKIEAVKSWVAECNDTGLEAFSFSNVNKFIMLDKLKKECYKYLDDLKAKVYSAKSVDEIESEWYSISAGEWMIYTLNKLEKEINQNE